MITQLKGRNNVGITSDKIKSTSRNELLHQIAKNLFWYFCIHGGLGVAHTQNS